MTEKIVVQFYAGYKGEETPRSITVGDRTYSIDEVLSRKRFQDKDSGQRYELFVCRVSGNTVKIRRDETGECELIPSADGFAFSPK